MKKRILVADDYEDSARAMATIIKLMGHEVCVAKDGDEAIRVAEEFRPDLILLDIAMPVVDGYDVCQHVRQQPWGASVILVAMTGWSADKFRERALEAGFDHFLVKPVAADLLEKLLGKSPEIKKNDSNAR
jgi:CheY-like chemotaxis protein